MGFGFDLTPDVFNFSVFIDEVRDTMDTVVFFAHEFFETPSSILLNHVGALVAEHRKWEVVFTHEVRLLLRCIRTDA